MAFPKVKSVEIPMVAYEAWDRNGNIKPHIDDRCCVCNRPCENPKFFLWNHLGGGRAVTWEDGELLNANGHANADLGTWPIGPDCLKKNPSLKDFVFKMVIIDSLSSRGKK